MSNPTQTGAESVVWSLSDLLASPQDPKLERVLLETREQAQAFSKRYQGKISALNAAELSDAYRELERFLSPYYKVSQYVHLVYATDTANDAIKALVARLDDIDSEVSNHLVFFDLEIGALPAEKSAQLRESKEMDAFRYSFIRSIETARFNLSEKEEQLANLKNVSGRRGWEKLYEELTSSFQFEFELDGTVKTMNGSQLRALRQHADPDVRRRAMDLFFSRYESHQLILTSIFNNIIKDCTTEQSLRGYTSAIQVRNIGNDLSDAAVEALHRVTTESYILVQRYYRLKAKLLNLPELTLSDIYAPLPSANHSFTWEEAKKLVLESFYEFDEECGQFVESMFTQNRIDARITPTKRGGAFCSSSTPDIYPYVLVNFLGRQRDVSTLAHELGHALHSYLCRKQPLTYYHSILPLAETASVFAEMMLTDKVLKGETNPLNKQAILTDKLEDIFATSHRQNMFSRFETQAHHSISDGLMSSKDLCTLYEKELHLMFGDSVKIPASYQWEWSAIPHIFESPFYVYAYNFGNLLVMALYQQFLEEGASFIPKYKHFLSMGSSATPKSITALMGADIENPDFWRKSLTYIESLIIQLEELVGSH
jgi:oligoendopeptidase F